MYFGEKLVTEYGVQNSGLYQFIEEYNEPLAQFSWGVEGKNNK